MKKQLPIILIITLACTALPYKKADAQTADIQKALESAKETLGNLVTAKDDADATELPLRIKTLSQAISLSTEEAKDVRAKLNDLDGLTKDEKVWRTETVKELNAAITYFNNAKADLVDASDTMTEADVKTSAGKFKSWRETNYLPTLQAARDLLLIDQQDKTIQTAKKREQKINDDIKKLEKAKVKNIANARKLLTNADSLIADAVSQNKEARVLFTTTYIHTDSTTTTDAVIAPVSTSTATDDAVGTSTPPSIKDLVTESSDNIKDAYKVFIDMSNLVRRLLK